MVACRERAAAVAEGHLHHRLRPDAGAGGAAGPHAERRQGRRSPTPRTARAWTASAALARPPRRRRPDRVRAPREGARRQRQARPGRARRRRRAADGARRGLRAAAERRRRHRPRPGRRHQPAERRHDPPDGDGRRARPASSCPAPGRPASTRWSSRPPPESRYRAPILRCRTAADGVRTLKARRLARRRASTAAHRTTSTRTRAPDGDGRSCSATRPRASRREVADLVDVWVSIPMADGVESLNVASAAAVVSFELLRRRLGAGGDQPDGTANTTTLSR